MPDAAGSWPEEGSAYQPGTPMEPVQQPYQQQPYPQQQYQQPYPQQQQYPAQPPQQQYAQAPQAGSYQEQTVPQPMMFAEEEPASVPSEFDHLFRDSVPADRRSISRQAVIGGAPAAAGFPQAAPAPAPPAPPQQPAATAMFPQQDQAEQTRTAGGYPQPGYGGPAGPVQDYPAGNGGGSGRSRSPLLIGGVVVVIAAVGLYLGLSGGSGNSGGHPEASSSRTAAATVNESPQQQADALYALVKQAKTLRSEINGGYDDLVACDITTAQSDIDTAVSGRQAALTTLGQLNVGRIPRGAELVDDLKTAWTYSYNSDQDYAKAATDFTGAAACSKSAVEHDPNFQAADSGSGDSSRAKDTAANLWNQVMSAYNEPTISSAEL